MAFETERLALRRFRVDDAEAMFRNWASDPEVTAFLTWPPHPSVDFTRQLLTQWVAEYDSVSRYNWAITLASTGEPIGSIGAVRVADETRCAHIGYCIGSAWWRQGFTSEALRGVIAFLVEKAGFNRIESKHDPRNPRSGHVMAACGLSYEGTLRQHGRSNRGICDDAMWAILADDVASKSTS